MSSPRSEKLISSLLGVLLAAALPFSNITYLWGVQDGGTRAVYVILAFVTLLLLLGDFRKHLIVKPISVIYVLLMLLMVTAVFAISDRALRPAVLEYGFRFFVLYGLVYIGRRYYLTAFIFAKRYTTVLFFSFCISLALWSVRPNLEFVFYDGSAARFGGLHFELFSFMYSLTISYVSFKHFYGWRSVCLLTLFFFSWNAQSNAAIPFLMIALAPDALILKIFRPIMLTGATILMVFSPILMGGFLDELGVLTQLEMRETADFNIEGSALYVRLYPHALAAQALLEQGFLSALLPSGLGWFEASDLVVNDERSMGGFGSSKMIADAGVVAALLICLTLSRAFNECCRIAPDMTALTVKLYFLSLFFVSFGSGFFNLVAWFIFLCWPKAMEGFRYDKTSVLSR